MLTNVTSQQDGLFDAAIVMVVAIMLILAGAVLCVLCHSEENAHFRRINREPPTGSGRKRSDTRALY